jgi:Kef-type K+ transport system membrane component KefB
MQGPKADTLLLLLATSLVPPICKQVNTSPILGFLLSGMAMGPNGLGVLLYLLYLKTFFFGVIYRRGSFNGAYHAVHD